jgi:hypothetical protein
MASAIEMYVKTVFGLWTLGNCRNRDSEDFLIDIKL